MIKKIYLCVMLLASTGLAFGQIGKIKNVGTASNFATLINNVSTSSDRDANSTFNIPTPTGATIIGKVNLKTSEAGKTTIVGSGGTTGSFSMVINPGGNITGLYTSVTDKKAYRYYTDELNNVMAKEVDINTVLCVDYNQIPENSNSSRSETPVDRMLMPIPKFQSRPVSTFVIYIDLDGETSKSRWNSGNTITAAARPWTDAEVQTLWEIVAQDFIVYDVNVTTDRAVYDAAAACKRKMCIVTSTDAAAPGAGGVAYVNTFDDCSNDPCWTFNAGAKAAGETTSHEIGHTVGLSHDGNSSTAYYSGHNNWAPIMGSSYKIGDVGHWSIGEYSGANQKQNDLTIIATQNTFGFIADDIPNTTSTTKALTIESNGSVLNTLNRGIINNRTDIDMFKFSTLSVGNLNLTIAPFNKNPNLNVQARLLNSTGTAIVTSSPPGTLYANMTATITSNNLPIGTYYLEIDGVGDGTDPTVGYSDYCSIGDFYITGTAPLPSNKPVPQFASSASKLCEGTQVTYTDQTTNVTSWKWTFPGGTPSSSTVQNPTVTYNSSGTYNVKLVVQNANGKDSLTKTNFVTVDNTPNAPTTTGGSRCGAGVVNLSAAGSGGTLDWYSASTGGTFVTNGTTYAPNLSASTTYYVNESNTATPQKVGPVDTSFGSGINFTANDIHGLLFDVTSPCRLKTVKVYSGVAGNRTVEVLTGVGGTVLHTKVVNIPAGESRITLDFDLTVGNQRFIKITGALINLRRTASGAAFPYNLAGLVSITETDLAPASTKYYYFFYDWEVTVPGCTSARTAVTGTINTTPPTPTITQSGSVLTSSATTGNQWYLNGIIISGATGKTHTATTAGNYTVIATVSGCASTASMPLNFTTTGITQTDNAYFFNIYPNPNDGNFNIAFNADTKANYKLELRNTLGQIIYQETLTDFTGAYSKQLSIEEFGKGIYMISLTNSKSETVKKVIVY